MLSYVIKQIMEDKMSDPQANAIIYACNTLLKTMDMVELEEQMKELREMYKQYAERRGFRNG